jgi:predicted transposase/invertase (TIGR01784 family)
MSSKLNNPHDKFFKDNWSKPEVAIDFINHQLPQAVSSCLNKNSLTLEKDSFIDAELSEHFSDMLYSLNFNNGLPCQLYLLFEHKSYPDRFTRLQCLNYMVKIWVKLQSDDKTIKALPPIIPVIVYHGKDGWAYDLNFMDLFESEIPDSVKLYLPNFQHVLCDLTILTDQDIKGTIITQVTMKLLKYISDPTLAERLPSILKLVEELSEQDTDLQYLYTVLRYVSSASDIGKDELGAIVRQTFLATGDKAMASAAEEWILEGEQRGEIRGEIRGELKGQAKVLANQIKLKFGRVSSNSKGKLESATSEQLMLWSERILSAESLNELFFN